jgi:hypothetical protein
MIASSAQRGLTAGGQKTSMARVGRGDGDAWDWRRTRAVRLGRGFGRCPQEAFERLSDYVKPGLNAGRLCQAPKFFENRSEFG